MIHPAIKLISIVPITTVTGFILSDRPAPLVYANTPFKATNENNGPMPATKNRKPSTAHPFSLSQSN